jgi:hypothetical protein
LLIRALVANTLENRDLGEWLHLGQAPNKRGCLDEWLCGPLDCDELSFALTILGEPVPFEGEDATRAALLFNRPGGGAACSRLKAPAAMRVARLATSNPSDFRKIFRLAAFG